MAKVMVSLPDRLLETVDATAAAQGTSRSELIRSALRAYLARAPVSARGQSIDYLRQSLAPGTWRAEDLVRSERER